MIGTSALAPAINPQFMARPVEVFIDPEFVPTEDTDLGMDRRSYEHTQKDPGDTMDNCLFSKLCFFA